ncbi:uncharacterized protein LOC126797201 [Argentina anserina]|uniref:uncharacterized protein LOC126797201 n=1 Tax=Argentina anserina TaxID=57926 RepID=UPI00217658DF|nr:uncharacterized protein LOC126797201 [Potentilla anserina]
MLTNEEVVSLREPPGFKRSKKGQANELSHGEVILGFNEGEEETMHEKMKVFDKDKPMGLRVALGDDEEALKNKFNSNAESKDKEASTSISTERPFKRSITFNTPLKIIQEKEVPLPYPQLQINERLKQINDTVKKKFLELFRKVEINIPQVSAILQRKLPTKLKDPGSFTVPCKIGNTYFDRALMDLGASINLMPYSVYKSLEIGDIRLIDITLQMADMSLTYLRGIVEDVLVKVEKLILPADFIILDTDDAPLHENELPIIFGRAFMATADTKIDVKEGLMTMTVHETTIAFRIFEAMSKPSHAYDYFWIDVLDGVDKMVEKTFIENAYQDPLETCLHHNGMKFNEEATKENELALEALRPYTLHLEPKVVVLLKNPTLLPPSIKCPPTL